MGFNINININLVTLANKAIVGCKIGTSCAAIFLYGDDVIL